MGIMSFIEKLFELVAPPKAKNSTEQPRPRFPVPCRLCHRPSGDGSRLPRRASCSRPRAHNTRLEKRHQNGRRNIESFATQHQSVINFMPVKGRVYFVRDATAVTSIA